MTESTLGHYRVLARLGKGGMGEVFLAEDLVLHRRVALKRLLGWVAGEGTAMERLRREAIALAAVNHPNVVTIHAVEEADGSPFVVMELVEGRTLAELLPPEGFEFPRLLDLAIPIAEALDAAHTRGVLHRDLKPGNVMVTAEGRVKVVDFGLAKLMGESATAEPGAAPLSVKGEVAGTLAYLAPEQLVGEPADRKSDLYALGILLYELASGQLPFRGNTTPWLMQQILLEEPTDLASLKPALPERFHRLVTSLMAKEPGRRPASARLVQEELARCRRGPGRPTPTTVAATPAPRRRRSSEATDLAVVQLLVRGHHLWSRRTESSLRAALDCFQQVIDRDPLQPKAWIGLADSLNLLSNYGFAPPGDSLRRVRAAVTRAVDLEGESSDGLRAQALATWQFDFDWAEAARLYQRALGLDTGNALTHHWYAVLLGVTEQYEESAAHFALAEALDPLPLISLATRGWFLLFAGRPEEAHAIEKRVLSLDAAYFPAWWFDGQALGALGRHDEAIQSFERAIQLSGRTGRMLGYLGNALGRAGRQAEARALLEELGQRSREEYIPPYFPAMIHAGLGEMPAALDRLEQSIATRDTMVRDLAVDTPWWPLVDEPRYQAALRALKLRA